MENSGVKFGTSGARGLVAAMTDEVCFAYTAAFLQHLESQQRVGASRAVAVAGDLRPSTGRIMNAVAEAIRSRGCTPIHCGRVPSPAVALLGLQRGIPAIMVTGSHIPDDRNGIKFNAPEGEILKHDEQGIRAQTVEIADAFDDAGMLHAGEATMEQIDPAAGRGYVRRWLDAFPHDALKGLRLGIYGHSAVGRELLVEIMAGLGAETVRLGWSEKFIPVDTEAIRREDADLGARWAREQGMDAIVSTDGDSDRPLISDEHGKWLRGDVAGILCARYLKADAVVAPVSCNTALEACGDFAKVVRTKIGSPYVIEAMARSVAEGSKRVVGYEANGGFLTASDLRLGARVLAALPTRDPVIVHLAILFAAKERKRAVSALLAELPQRFTASDRLQEFPPALSQAKLAQLGSGSAAHVGEAFEGVFGPVATVSTVDGVRVTFATGEVVHVRASGNAPELRCYTEASTETRAMELNAQAMAIVGRWRGAGSQG